ncbi:D-alanyl-D-alanine carboxypeptidase/D-alanyl-D-alanine endopeptidase [Granulicella arctica]|uniref:D-alanyl-D-alanine carboxypeptidase/D-alanyl-D-alanine-endopeptidase (Penicillin-binding protein 4) n=1 Tax=Granulicella arctica TaxID=940613 RepID=A0A7Y9PFK7_9BACT|nr:D-alanyl-D-alanine carboxypeptidase/D-alanyl-D-alanine-endopeptidase (penicillin-binding protein 4) [Granulicella arctica]
MASTAVWAALGSVHGVAQTELARQIAAMVAEPAVARAHWGVMVTAMDGTPIYGLNEGQLFQPASNAKLFTTAAAVHLLGGARRFETVVDGPSGSTVEATLHGDLTIHGSGDANLSGRAIPYVEPADKPKGADPVADPLRYLAEMADKVAATGVKRVTGDIVGDDTLFPWQPYAEDWAADDLVWGYGAPVSALTISDNQLRLTVTPGVKAGDAATVVLDPAMPYYTVEASVRTVAAKAPSSVDIERPLGSKVLKVSGTIAVDAGADVEEVAIQDPAEYAALALKAMLEARGIKVDGVARAEHRVIEEPSSFLKETREPLPNLPKTAVAYNAVFGGCFDACPLSVEHRSPTVMEDITVTNKVSQNLHAELLLHQLGKVYGTDGSTAEGSRAVRQFLLNVGLDKDDFVFYDGSGLSGHDLVAPRATAKLLQFASTQPWFADWKKSLPVGGLDGSLAARFPNAPLKGRVFAKTGTLGEARALSGYVECASGRTVIFSIMVGSHMPGTSADREVMDRIVAAIAAAN